MAIGKNKKATLAGSVATGAAVGAAIAGPGAPIGAAIGGLVGAVVGSAATGTVGQVVKNQIEVRANQIKGLLEDVWRAVLDNEEILEQLPDIGMLQTERAVYPPAMSELSSTNSYLYQLKVSRVRGLAYRQALEGGALTDEQVAALREAVAALEAKQVVAITGDCGAMINYQHEVSQMTRLPVLLSPLLQAPLLATVFRRSEKVLVVASDKTATTEAKLAEMLAACGLPASEVSRFSLVGCEHIAGFSASELEQGATLDAAATMAGLLSLVRDAVEAEPQIRAVLLESTMLPAFADALRQELKLPTFDSTTLVDLVHKGMTDNPRFGVSFGPKEQPELRLQPDELPALGIMRIDYTYPPAMGDAAHPSSYYYRTPHAVVRGLTFEAAQAGAPLSDEQRAAMREAISTLEAEPDMMGIAGDCGFLINYQEEAVECSQKVPCFISAILQCPLLAALLAKDAKTLVLTANGPALRDVFPALLAKCGVAEADHGRFVVDGCEALPGFEAVANAEKVDVAKVQPHVVSLVQRHVGDDPTIRAVLLECTELPPYADAIRHATGLLVLDVITLIDYFHAAVSPNPYFGIDWEKLSATPSRSAASSSAAAAAASSAASSSSTAAAAPPPRATEAPKKAEIRETAALGKASKGSRESMGGDTGGGGGGGGGGVARGNKTGGFTYKETYDLYNQQLHYAKSHYTTPQLNAWQTDWNKYFAKYNMDVPVYAHKVVKGRGGKARGSTME